MTELTKQIYETLKSVPKGHVITYGQLAELVGNKNLARTVGNALHNNPEPDTIPCFRVVNADGKLAVHFAFGGAEGQKRRLEADGINVVNGKVDLKKYGWQKP